LRSLFHLPSKSRLSSSIALALLVTGGVLAAISLPAAHAASESTVGSTTDAYGLGYAADGHTCGTNGRFWVFYNDGTNWGWKSSTDGVNWSAETTFASAIPKPPTQISDISFTCVGDTVYYAGGSVSSSDNHFYFNSGTLNPGGTISWNTETSQATQGYDVRFPSIALDSNGNVWVALLTDNTAGTSYIEVWESGAGGWSSSLTPLSFTGSSPVPQIVALTSGKMGLLYGSGSTQTSLETFNGASWAAAASTAPYIPWLSTAVAIGDTIEYCGSNGADVYYLSFTYATGLWSAPSTISGGLSCSATTDGSSVLGLFYVTSSTTIMYSQSNNAGTSFSVATPITTADSGLDVVGASLAVSTNPDKQAMAVWLSNTPSTNSIKFGSVSTAPVVNEEVTITDANAAPAGAVATVSGCHASVSTIAMNGAPQTFGADPSCSLTITVPSDTLYTRYRFPGTVASWTYETGSSGTDVESNTVYYQYAITASYSVSGGSPPPPPAPAMTSTETGSAISPTLTGTPTVYWLDSAAGWSVPPTITNGATTWSTAPSSGTASGPTTLSFVYAPPVTSTTTTTTTSTVTSTTTLTQTATSTTTSPTTITSTVTSTTTAATATVTTTLTTATTHTVTSTSTSTSTLTDTTTATKSTTLTSTTTVTSTSTVSIGASDPSASSMTCDQSRPQVNQRVNCTDLVWTADSGIAAGNVTWTTTGGGTFARDNCDSQSDFDQLQCQIQYTPTASGVQTLTATYSGDPYHSSSSDTAVVFVGNTASSKATSLSLTCSQTYVQLGQSTNCQATVLTANGGNPTGTVSWTATDSGTFSHESCQPNYFGNGQLQCSAQYTPRSAGAQVVTATYSGDPSHQSSSGTFEVFVQNNPWQAFAEQAAVIVPGGALVAALGAVVFQAKKGRGKSKDS
jgi:trimeric autotransporter adhesin